MNNLLTNHVKDVDDTIEFLNKYKAVLTSNFELNNNNLAGILILNNKIDELKDSILNIVNTLHNTELEPYLQKEVNEHNEYNDNIKKLLPFLTLLFINIPNLSQVDL